jgi:hypothetical protein
MLVHDLDDVRMVAMAEPNGCDPRGRWDNDGGPQVKRLAMYVRCPCCHNRTSIWQTPIRPSSSGGPLWPLPSAKGIVSKGERKCSFATVAAKTADDFPGQHG